MSGPTGPRIRPRVTYDDDGEYTIYVGKSCGAEGCGVELTSRNRYYKYRFCREHGMENDRQRIRNEACAGPKKPRAPREKKAKPLGETKASYSVNPKMEKVHKALNVWLCWPDDEDARGRLHAELVDYELRHRLQDVLYGTSDFKPATFSLLPALAEDIDPVNPLHRTTHLEFLSDCDTYGV
jgi:hypothetical protein